MPLHSGTEARVGNDLYLESRSVNSACLLRTFETGNQKIGLITQ